jgi:hypothetical protein
MQTDAVPLGEAFRNDYTNFLGNLPWTSMIKGDAVLERQALCSYWLVFIGKLSTPGLERNGSVI